MRGPRTSLVLLLAAFVALHASQASAGERSPPEDRGRASLRIGTATRPDTLNPLVTDNRLGRILASMLYDDLLPYTPSGRPQRGVVTEWKPSADRRLWLLELRPGMRWSDGRAITARDVVHTLSRLRDRPRTRFTRWVEDITLVERFGRHRVGVRFARPRRAPPELPVPVLPRHIWKSVQGEDVAEFANDPPIGSGPFASTMLSDGDTMLLTAREGHWRGEPSVDEITLRFYESQSALLDALRSGQVDVADDLGPDEATSLASHPDIEVRPTPATAFVSLGINTGATNGDGALPLREARVRRAIAHSLDREQLRQLALGPYGEAGSTIVPPALPEHVAPTGAAELALDPARAAALLRRAGLRDRDGDGIREDSIGLPFKLRLFTRRALPETGVVGEQIAESLEAVGIEVALSALTDRELRRRIRQGRYDLFVWGWDVGDDPTGILAVLTCAEATASGLSDTYYCDPEYDELYARFAKATGNAQRQRLLAAMQLRAYSRVPYVVLYYRPTFQAFRTDRFEAPADESIPIVFAAPPQSSINLELRPTAAPPPPEAPDDTGAEAAPPGDLVEEIQSSRLWQLLALAGVVVLALLLLPRVVRGVVWLVRRRRRRSAAVETDEGTGAEGQAEPENDGGRP